MCDTAFSVYSILYKVMRYLLEFHVVLQAGLFQAGTTCVCYTQRSIYFVYLFEPTCLFDQALV